MAESSLRKPRWYLIPVRIVLVTFVVTLLSFAVSLLLGIFGVVLAAKVKGAHPNMTLAYRDVALPVAAMVGTVVLIFSAFMEIRHYRQAKALRQIADQMHSAR
jgi:ABC-type sugar transport system permease subunit